GGDGEASLSLAMDLGMANRWVAAFLSAIIVLTTLGNSLLILLILTQRSLSTISNHFLVSLFVSDLLVGLVVMPPAMLNHLYGHWLFGGGFCAVWSSCDVMCCSASILNLCLISLDRYLLITSPLQYKLKMTSSRAVLLILTTWTVAALTSFLPIEMGWHEMGIEVHPHNVTFADIDGDQCRLLVSLPYALIASSLTFFLPSAAISFTYCRILRAARSQIHCSPERRSYTMLPELKKALKASLTLGVLLGMFFVTWLPFFVANVAQCVPALLFDVLTWLGYCNSTMNPVIYPLFMRDFKRAIAKYLRCCGRWRERRPSVASLSGRVSGRSGSWSQSSGSKVLKCNNVQNFENTVNKS
uniref:G-protein coupled receptors family 1 profile domain-containing protein n=1 Tax=Callorhinchus milii TaxID=7868 RepID=A0A4W3JIT4_CALMI